MKARPKWYWTLKSFCFLAAIRKPAMALRSCSGSTSPLFMSASRSLSVKMVRQAPHCETWGGTVAEHMGHCHKGTMSAIAALLKGRGELWRLSVRNRFLMVKREDSCHTWILRDAELAKGDLGSAQDSRGHRLGPYFPACSVGASL